MFKYRAALLGSFALLFAFSVIAEQATPITNAQAANKSAKQMSLWVESVAIDTGETCNKPNEKPVPKYELGEGGLDGIVQFFSDADLNKDGKVCLDEIRAIQPNNVSSWLEYDRNKDGCITPTEVKETIEATIISYWKSEFFILDGNRNGFIELSEIINRYGHNPEGMKPDEIIAAFDTDKDGAISQVEFIKGSVRMYHEIKNGNPTLGKIEKKPLPAASAPASLEERGLAKKLTPYIKAVNTVHETQSMQKH